LSKNPTTGVFEKIETQRGDNRMVIDRLGGVLGKELDDGLSAWKKNVRRPGWEMLLERVASGASDGIVVWHTDRLFRQPRDLEKLIDLADKGFMVASAHGARDVSDSDDRFILRIEVAQAAKSSDDMSRRIKCWFQTYRENGVGHIGGPRRFGWPGRDLTWTPGEGETDEGPADGAGRAGGAGTARDRGRDSVSCVNGGLTAVTGPQNAVTAVNNWALREGAFPVSRDRSLAACRRFRSHDRPQSSWSGVVPGDRTIADIARRHCVGERRAETV
jgi:hypothetical protein